MSNQRVSETAVHVGSGAIGGIAGVTFAVLVAQETRAPFVGSIAIDAAGAALSPADLSSFMKVVGEDAKTFAFSVKNEAPAIAPVSAPSTAPPATTAMPPPASSADCPEPCEGPRIAVTTSAAVSAKRRRACRGVGVLAGPADFEPLRSGMCTPHGRICTRHGVLNLACARRERR